MINLFGRKGVCKINLKLPQKNFCGELSAVFLGEAWVGGTWASELISCG